MIFHFFIRVVLNLLKDALENIRYVNIKYHNTLLGFLNSYANYPCYFRISRKDTNISYLNGNIFHNKHLLATCTAQEEMQKASQKLVNSFCSAYVSRYLKQAI